MAVVNTKSVSVTAHDATPPTSGQDNRAEGGVVKSIRDYVSVAAGDDNDSTFRLARVHSSWSITSIVLYNDAITGGTDYNLGLHYAPGEDGTAAGAVISENCYADAIDLSSANKDGKNYKFEALAVNKIRQRVWQDAGLSTDPKKWFDVVLKGITVGTGAGDIGVQVGFVSD